MSKISRYGIFTILFLGLSLISYSQLKTDVLYSYDSYWQVGVSGIIAETGDIVYKFITPPYSTNDILVSIGYVPMIPISSTLISFFTNTTLFISAKIYTIAIFIIFVCSFYILVKKLSDSHIIGLLSLFILMFIPLIFYRMNIFVNENSAITTWLFILYVLLSSTRKKLNFALIPLFVYAFAVHPRSTMFYFPVAFILYFSISNQSINVYFSHIPDIINQNRILISTIILLGFPFLYFFVINLLAYLNQGASYPLYPPNTVVPLGNTLLLSTLGATTVPLFLLSIPTIISKSSGNNKYRFVIGWILLIVMLLWIGIHLNFPTNRLIFHLGIISVISASIFLGIFIKNDMFNKKMIPIVLMIFVVLMITNFYSSPWHEPFVGWGIDEKEGMQRLSETTNNLPESTYIIFTPEMSLPFGYGLKNIEMDENVINNVLTESKTPDELLDHFKAIYPNKSDYYVIVGIYSKNILAPKYVVIKELDTINPFYKNNRLTIYHFSSNDETWSLSK